MRIARFDKWHLDHRATSQVVTISPVSGVFAVLQRDAHLGEFVADAVAFFEVLGFARGEAGGDEL